MLLALCIWVLESPAAGIRKLRFLSLTTKPPELVSVYECLAGRLFWNPAADDFDFAEAQAYCLALDGAALQRTRFARGWNRLARGCYNQAAWSDFEERFATLYSGEKIIDSREHWDGSLLNGKTLLVDMEERLVIAFSSLDSYLS